MTDLSVSERVWELAPNKRQAGCATAQPLLAKTMWTPTSPACRNEINVKWLKCFLWNEITADIAKGGISPPCCVSNRYVDIIYSWIFQIGFSPFLASCWACHSANSRFPSSLSKYSTIAGNRHRANASSASFSGAKLLSFVKH